MVKYDTTGRRAARNRICTLPLDLCLLYTSSSVFGGTTANSEYEFLTGNTTAFLPAGTVP